VRPQRLERARARIAGVVRVALFGARGRVGRVLEPALAETGHDVTPVARDEQPDLAGHDAAVDFTRPDAVALNVARCMEAGVPCIVGTTGANLEEVGALAAERGLQLFFAPNFAIGAVLMMRFAAEASKLLPHAEIIELHHHEKLDAPSGTARETARRIGHHVPIHSVRLPGLVAHQEVLFGAQGQTLTIRHDTTSREAFVPGVLLALERLHELRPGLTVGLDALLF
jgi:4-hydroxy-tetrahydrodipicolinate reductase